MLPCEVIIVNILPIMRKELAIKLVDGHRFMKADVARMFGVSGTAISQYIHGTRGHDTSIKDCPNYTDFIREIAESASRIALKKGTVIDELCRLCDYAKRTGMHEYVRGGQPQAKCPECPRKGLI
ncbi:MAG: transcriptional regulator [Methanomassiliicoccaceae archaeon]|nr:transcriptional regulator [Methanomassiliicoccaceae archaeon]